MRSSDLAALMNDVFNTDANPAALGHASDVSDDDALSAPADAPPAVRQLRECQRWALAAIMQGKGYTAAARCANVARKTVYNWAKNDAVFKAAMEG